MLKVGLTGGVASGKTEVLGILRGLGTPTLSSDEIVRSLTAPGRPAVARIRRRFGTAAVRSDGSANRGYLRDRVLSDPRDLDWLERTLHPGVRSAIRQFFKKNRTCAGVAVVEVPLLFENGFYKFFDRVVCVRTGASAARRRAAKRGMTADLYDFFSKRQWPPARKAAASDIVIVNNGSLKELKSRVTAAYKKLFFETRRK